MSENVRCSFSASAWIRSTASGVVRMSMRAVRGFAPGLRTGVSVMRPTYNACPTMSYVGSLLSGGGIMLASHSSTALMPWFGS